MPGKRIFLIPSSKILGFWNPRKSLGNGICSRTFPSVNSYWFSLPGPDAPPSPGFFWDILGIFRESCGFLGFFWIDFLGSSPIPFFFLLPFVLPGWNLWDPGKSLCSSRARMDPGIPGRLFLGFWPGFGRGFAPGAAAWELGWISMWIQGIDLGMAPGITDPGWNQLGNTHGEEGSARIP